MSPATHSARVPFTSRASAGGSERVWGPTAGAVGLGRGGGSTARGAAVRARGAAAAGAGRVAGRAFAGGILAGRVFAGGAFAGRAFGVPGFAARLALVAFPFGGVPFSGLDLRLIAIESWRMREDAPRCKSTA